MSRIYRSRQSQPPMARVDYNYNQVGPQRPDRPAGGFVTQRGDEQLGEVLSAMEQRKRQATHIIEQAQREAETIQRDAYHAGFEQGERAGEKLATQKIEPTVQMFESIIEKIHTERQSLVERHRDDLIKVAFAIATQVVKKTIELDPEVIGHVFEEALRQSASPQPMTVRLNPNDEQLLIQFMQKRGTRDWPPEDVTIRPDETIGRGGCRIEMETGDIEATIDSQIRMLKELVLNA